MGGRHLAPRVPTYHARKTLAAVTALALATSTCGDISPVPLASAAVLSDHIVAGPLQTFHVGQDVIAPPVVRDPSTATTQVDLDAARKHEAEAAAAAAHLAVVKAVAHRGPTHFLSPAHTRSGDAIVAYARQYVGIVPYSTGASPAAGFECDGLTQWVYAAFGVLLPRGVNEQAAHGVQVASAAARSGDLVVYPGQHVGIYDGAGGIIDSSDWGRFVSHRAVWGHPVYIRIP